MNEADQQVYGELVPHNRDPYNNNDFLKVSFRDVICEPPAIRSSDCSYEFTQVIYDKTATCTYATLTLVFGGFLSFVYGLFCGLLTCGYVWFGTPALRVWLIALDFIGKLWKGVLMNFYEPLFDSLGKIFAHINANVTHRSIQEV